MDERSRISDSELISGKEVARRIGVDMRTLYRWRTQKGMPHLKFGCTIRYRWAAVSAWASVQAIMSRTENYCGRS